MTTVSDPNPFAINNVRSNIITFIMQVLSDAVLLGDGER